MTEVFQKDWERNNERLGCLLVLYIHLLAKLRDSFPSLYHFAVILLGIILSSTFESY